MLIFQFHLFQTFGTLVSHVMANYFISFTHLILIGFKILHTDLYDILAARRNCDNVHDQEVSIRLRNFHSILDSRLVQDLDIHRILSLVTYQFIMYFNLFICVEAIWSYVTGQRYDVISRTL